MNALLAGMLLATVSCATGCAGRPEDPALWTLPSTASFPTTRTLRALGYVE